MVRAGGSMKKVYGKICIVVMLICLSGCGSSRLTYTPSLLHFSSPETFGKLGKGSINFSAALSPEYTFNDTVVSSDPVSVSTEESYPNINIWLGLLNNLDFYLDADGVYGLKLQLIGASHTAREAGLKLSTELRLGNDTSNKGLKPSNNSSNVDIIDYGINLGYRFNASILTYMNTFISKNNLINVAISSATVSTKSQGVLLGAQLTPQGKPVSVIFEAGVTQTTWDNFETLTAYPFGISLGYVW